MSIVIFRIISRDDTYPFRKDFVTKNKYISNWLGNAYIKKGLPVQDNVMQNAYIARTHL